MRFSVLHLLLFGAALAAPINDVSQTSKRGDEKSLVSRGLVPVLPRSPVAVIPPKTGPKTPPVHGPEGPGGVKPPVTRPDAPGTAPDAPEPLRPNPNDPPNAPGNTQPDHPGLTPPDDTRPPPTRPDDNKPPNTKPDDANAPIRASDDLDGPINVPEVCARGKRCIGTPPPFDRSPTEWTVKRERLGADGQITTKEVDVRKSGWQSRKTLEEVAAGNQQTQPPKYTGNLDDRYTVGESKDVQSLPKGKYVQDGEWADAFSNSKEFQETKIYNQDAQVVKQKEWAKTGFKEQLKKNGAKEDELEFADMDQDLDSIPIATVLTNPSKGSLVVKGSFNNEKDLYQPYAGKYLGYDYVRPGFGETQNKVGWTDQMMATWRRAKSEAGPDGKDLKYIAQDDITDHSDTRQVIDGVYKLLGKSPGDMITLKRPGNDVTSESAAFDALAGTVHAQRPIQMATDHHVELGNPTVEAIHVLKLNDNRYDMIVEFGRLTPATTS